MLSYIAHVYARALFIMAFMLVYTIMEPSTKSFILFLLCKDCMALPLSFAQCYILYIDAWTSTIYIVSQNPLLCLTYICIDFSSCLAAAPSDEYAVRMHLYTILCRNNPGTFFDYPLSALEGGTSSSAK